MSNIINVKIIMRWNSAEGWASLKSEDTILSKGEIGLEYISNTSIPKMKIGDGISPWKNLPYFETSLPQNYTWGNLRGTSYIKNETYTENLNLSKPGFSDVVNINVLNKNFDTLDKTISNHLTKLNTIGKQLSELVALAENGSFDSNSLESEIITARGSYPSLGEALQAIENDLKDFKDNLDNIIGKNLPNGLFLENDGTLSLIDDNGNKIGESVTVKDNMLSAEVAGIRMRYNEDSPYNTAYEAVRAIDKELKEIRNRETNGQEHSRAVDTITAIDIEQKNTSEKVTKLENEKIPHGFIYENNQLSLANAFGLPIGEAIEIVGGGGGGSASSYTISLINNLEERIFSVAENVPVILKFSYSSIDEEGIQDGAGGGELLINNFRVANFSVPQGLFELNITSYLSKGANDVKIKVTNSEGSYKILTYTISIVALSIVSSFPSLGAYNTDSVEVGYILSGEGTKTVHYILTKQAAGGQSQLLGTETVFSNGQARQFSVSRPLTSGAYILEIYATVGTGDNIIYSNTIRIGMIWYTNNDISPFILINSPQLSAIEGETIHIPYFVYYPNDELPNVTFSIVQHNILLEDETIGDKIYSEKSAPIDRTSKIWTIQDFPSGEISFRISCESTVNDITMTIQKSDFDKTIVQDGLLLEFKATGRQNSDIDHDKWSYNNIEAEFNNIGWSSIDGWYVKEGEEQTVLRLLPGSSMYIPFYPFASDITSTGYTIEAEIATQNVSDYDSIIIESFSGGRGFLIKSQSAQIKSTGSSISTQFKEDDKVRLTFVVEQYTSNRLVTIYINGISCGIQQYPQNDIFTHPNTDIHGITIGAETCGIDVYFLRFYKIPFTSAQQLNNYIVDRPTLSERIKKNQINSIIDESTDDPAKKVTIASLKGTIPYLVMECPELPQFKGDKKTNMSFTFVDPLHPERSFTAKKVQFDVQGTSSAGYPVKNFKLKLGKIKDGGGIIYTESGKEAEGFKFRGDDSLLTKVFCLKADYASSESANNVMLVDYYNETCPYRNAAQQENSLVRWGVHGEPIVLFWRNTIDNELYFQGKYNMNDDKDNENVFGFVDVLPQEEFPNIECWEFLNNNTSLCLFNHINDENNSAWFEKIIDEDGNEIDAWVNSYERRFPEQDDDTVNNLSNFQRMINWVASTNRNRAFNTIPLPQEVYYKTLDKSYNSNKQYYYYDNVEKKYLLKTIQFKDAIRTTDEKVTILVENFKTAVKNIDSSLSLYRDWLCKKEENLWNIFYIEEENEILFAPNISNLESFGIGIGQNYNSKIIVFTYYLGNDWNNSLYEKHTHDTSDYRLAKFKNEIENYFVLEPLTYYYIFTETFLLMDSRAKNMFLMTFDGEHWFPSPYDMDTSFGINNEGQLVFDYNLEDTDTSSGSFIFNGKDKLYDGVKTYKGFLDLEKNKFISETGEEINYKGSLIFNGQESVLWNNFRDCFSSEIEAMYQKLRSQKGNQPGEMPFSFSAISNKMNTHQNMWPEVIWNIDQEIKYLNPFYNGINNLAMAQGDKRTQRNFWTFNTFKYRDSKYKTADSVNNYIHLRLYDKGTIEITPYSHIYARVEFGNAKDEQKRAFRNETITFTTEGITTVNDLETRIFSSDRISKIGDLSSFKIGYCDFSMAPKLQEIIVGSEEEGYLNGNLTTFTLGSSELLKFVNISNCNNLTGTIDASSCPTLKIFKAKGSSISGVNFSTGGRLEEYYAPSTLNSLILREQSHLKVLDITKNSNNTYNLVTLWLNKTPNIDFFEMLKNSPLLEYLRLDGIEWHTTEEELRQFFNLVLKPVYNEDGSIKEKIMGSLNNEGRPIIGGGGIVTGTFYVPSISEELLFLINEHLPNVTLYVNNIPKYFIRYVTYDNKLLYSYLAEDGQPAIDPIIDDSIPIEKKEEILAEVRKRPNEDSNNDGIIDTFYTFDEDNHWENLPTKVEKSYSVRPAYNISYLTRYFYEQNGEKLYETKTLRGQRAIDPVIENKIEIPTKDTTAQYTFNYIGWTPIFSELYEPKDYYVSFEENINSYTVKFISGQKELQEYEQIIEYNGSPILPNTEIVKNYYKINSENYSYYEIYEHIGWDIYNDGEIEIDFENNNELGLIIKPTEYTEEPIYIHAVFSAIKPINDTWDVIIENCNNGKYKIEYPVGTQKEIKFIYDGLEYSGIVEVVEQDKDILSSDNSKSASLTFILKDIFKITSFRNNSQFIGQKLDENGNQIIGPLAGGWTDNPPPIYLNLKNISFLDVLEKDQSSLLKDNIKVVSKITDYGPKATGSNEYYPTENRPETIWTPSASEMGVLPSSNLSPEAKQGDTYIWFTNDESRIKKYNDIPYAYWTRTWEGSPYRFYGVGENGASALDKENNALGLRSYDTAGLIFGFCL